MYTSTDTRTCTRMCTHTQAHARTHTHTHTHTHTQVSKLEASLESLRLELQRAELAVEGRGEVGGEALTAEGLTEARRLSILSHIDALEQVVRVCLCG